MNPEKVIFGFFIVLALTLNFGFFVGEIDNPEHHHLYELFAVVVVNLIATNGKLALKFLVDVFSQGGSLKVLLCAIDHTHRFLTQVTP